ncbi:MAG: type II toxin-antitoxin system PemK/MazF family toxin [Oscillospiraceae bacterium]|nr:type II toxin-antitoxin system PemK/MazF family toxin [Oscillospiraceae bacterium]
MNTDNYINNSEMSARDKIIAMLDDEDFIYKRGNIVWINVPEELKGVTHIQSGVRRGLIFSNDVNNLFSDLIYIIPCSSKSKKMKFHVKHENQYILAEQLNPIDKSWIMTEKEIVQIDEETMKTVEDSFLKQFGMRELMAS